MVEVHRPLCSPTLSLYTRMLDRNAKDARSVCTGVIAPIFVTPMVAANFDYCMRNSLVAAQVSNRLSRLCYRRCRWNVMVVEMRATEDKNTRTPDWYLSDAYTRRAQAGVDSENTVPCGVFVGDVGKKWVNKWKTGRVGLERIGNSWGTRQRNGPLHLCH